MQQSIMDIQYFLTWATLLSTFLFTDLIRLCTAKPTIYDRLGDIYVPLGSIDRFDDDYYSPLSSYRLNHLRRGYYYVDDGLITAVSPTAFGPAASANRRQDTAAGGSTRGTGSSRYRPLVNYRQTKTKRKKLFVPNLYG